MIRTLALFIAAGILGCASHRPPPLASDFLSDGLSHPKKIETTEVQSRYWVYNNFIVHFISNINDQNKNQTPIIYIHGLGGSVDTWLELIKIMHPNKSSRPYYAIDLPPFGRSAMQDSELSIHAYTEMLQDFVAMLGVQKVNLVCHSLGGQVCIDYALGNPGQIQLLTLVSPAGTFDKSAFVSHAASYYAGVSVGSVDSPNARTIGDMTWYYQEFNRRMITNDPLVLIAVESFKENFRGRIQKLRAKTLLIWGHDDNVFSYENGLYLKENIENATLYVLDGAGHTPFKSHAAAISKLIQKYL